MKCSKCDKEATVKFTEVKNKQKKDVLLCELCAKDYQKYIAEPVISYSLSDIADYVSGQDTISNLVNKLLQILEVKSSNESHLKCDHCGITFQEFQKTGRFGCPKDYRVFRKQIKGILKEIHGNNRHVGKVPQSFRKLRQLITLRKQLDKAIAIENYEKAIEIRDKIQLLEQN